jgi:glycosyltransferase involved in cell wall biosynthesis
MRAKLLQEDTGIKINITPLLIGKPYFYTHQEMLSMNGKARISITLNISDGVSTSLLEAIVMGAFPIQSYTACANEWVEDGKTGLLVHPEDTESVEHQALKKA